MSESGLYPKGPSDAERKAMLKRLDDEREANWEADRQKREAKEREEREAEAKAAAAEREAEQAARVEVEAAEISALVGDPVALVRLVLALKAEVSAMKAGPKPVAEPPSFAGQFQD